MAGSTRGDTPAPAGWTADVFRSATGDVPFERFLDGLSDFEFVALDAAIGRVLLVRGIHLARTEWLKALGRGLHEFRVRHDAEEIAHMLGGEHPDVSGPEGRILLRVFVHFHGEKRVLLLGGYDKSRDPSDRRQRREIAAARRRLAEFRRRVS
jgi:hypothetical protein